MKNAEIKLSDFRKGEKKDKVKKALNMAKETKRPQLVGIDYDDQFFIEDAEDYSPFTELNRVFATVYPDGRIFIGFIEVNKLSN